MQVAEALVSGSLGQAIYREGGALCILDAPMADPREALPNETQWFRHAAREVVAAHPEGLPVSIEQVRECLDEEIRFFRGLDGLLVGMDGDFSAAIRQRAISRAEDVLSANDAIARRIRERFLIPANTQEWDPVGGLALAVNNGAKAAGDCYQPLATGIIDRLADDVAAIVLEKLGSGSDAAYKREAILRSGLVAELAFVEASGDRAALSALVFRRDDFPKLRDADASGQIFVAVVRRLEARITSTDAEEPSRPSAPAADGDQESETPDPDDPIMAAVERVRAHHERRGRRSREGSSEDVPGIQREIAWIGERLRSGKTERAEKALVQLIDRQGPRSRAEDIVKTLTAVADLARGSRLYDLTERLLAAVDRIGRPDSAAMCVRAETLRDLGRYEEALAAFEETMQRFPHDEVAPNARAETLRDLGRYEEALAAFEETMQRFPHNEVARNAYAHLLAQSGQVARAETLLAPAAARARTRSDWIAKHILSLAQLRAGRIEQARVELERGVQSCPFKDVREYFETALPLALLSERRAPEAARQLEVLAKSHTLPPERIANVVLFQAHALAEAGETRRAQTLVTKAEVIDFAAARQRRLAAALSERYGLVSGIPASAARARQLNEDIATLEIELARPKLWSFRARAARAA